MRATAAPRSTSPMRRIRITSAPLDLDLDDLLDHERPRHRPGGGEAENDPAAEAGDERVEIVRMLEPDGKHDDYRERRDDPARHTSLHREGVDEPLEIEPLTDCLRHSVDDFGRVAAGLTLQLRDERQL